MPAPHRLFRPILLLLAMSFGAMTNATAQTRDVVGARTLAPTTSRVCAVALVIAPNDMARRTGSPEQAVQCLRRKSIRVQETIEGEGGNEVQLVKVRGWRSVGSN